MRKLYYLFVAWIAACVITGCDSSAPEVKFSLPSYVTQEDASLVMSQGDLRVEVLPLIGGRICSLQVDGHELLAQAPRNQIKNWGVLLWSSPQAEWQWPPIAVLDNLPYNIEKNSELLELTSGIDKKTGYQFSKTYSPISHNALAITYKIYNRTQHEKTLGAIEVSRLPASGDVLFPSGDTAPISGIFYPLNIQNENGLSWFQYDAAKIRDDHHKMMMDGKEGWVAYRDQGYLLIKQFEDVSPEAVAEGEREIEIFAHVDHTFIEVKQQSAVKSLAPGEFLAWTVVWRALKLPPELSGDIQPNELANFVRAELKKN